MEENPRAKAAILAAVEEQINSPESPYVREHYNRLLALDIDKDDVMKLLGSVLAAEMWEISVQGREFDEKQYIERLEKLPDTSWMDD